MKFSNKKLNNNKIIRLIDYNGKQIGLIDINKAIVKAKKNNLDLILLNPNCNPPVYKIGDYGKYIYNKSKNIKNNKNKKNNIKEIRIKPNIHKNDYNIKINKINYFLNKGYKVKLSLIFKGREIIHKNIGIEMINNIYKNFKNISSIIIKNNVIKIENNQIILNLIPKKNNNV